MSRRPKCQHCDRLADGLTDTNDPACTGCATTDQLDMLCRYDCNPVSAHPIYRPGVYHCLCPVPYPAGNTQPTTGDRETK